MKEICYTKGILLYPSEHLKKLPEFIFGLDMELKYHIRVLKESDWRAEHDKKRSLEQNNTLYALISLIDEAKLKDGWNEEKIKIHFMFQLRQQGNFILNYYGVTEGKGDVYFEESEARKCDTWLPIRNSTALISKKEMTLLIDYILRYCERDDVLPNLDRTKYETIRKGMEK